MDLSKGNRNHIKNSKAKDMTFKSIEHVLRSRYGNLVVKELRKFETIDYSLRKCKLDLTFLMVYLHDNIITKVLTFCVSNSYLKSSRAYHACQINLPKKDISIKKSRIRTLEKDFNNRKEKLRETLGIIDFTLFVYFSHKVIGT